MRTTAPPRPQQPLRQRPDVAVCYGTRPQVIKAARLVPALRSRWEVLTVDTGQHYDYALNAGLYHDLRVAPPAVFLGVGAAHAVEQTARIAAAASHVLMARAPRVVVVIGDTNSTLGCAIAATELGIPLVHVEAGLRSGVADMAEERTRLAVDALSRVLCAPSDLAVATLQQEGLGGTVVQTGDVSLDVLNAALGTAPPVTDVAELPAVPFVLATLHRAELADNRERLAGALAALGQLGLPVVFPMHPRTAARVTAFELGAQVPENVRVLPPFGYLANLTALRHAAVVVTDSGGVQREAYWLGTPCVTLRGETEWPETVTCGANRLVLPDDAVAGLAAAVRIAMSAPRAWSRKAYGDGTAAEAIADAVAPLITPSRTRVRALVTQ